jgi:hypothetical protein
VGRLREDAHPQRDDEPVSEGGPAVAALLEETPAWSDVPAGDTDALRKIEEACRRIADLGPEAAKDGIRRFVAAHSETPAGLDVAAMSKLYVLIRYIFAAPQDAPKGLPRFGSFQGVPETADTVDELWPWEPGPDGELGLTAFFRGYAGETYLAEQEADAFEDRYGLRSSPPRESA